MTEMLYDGQWEYPTAFSTWGREELDAIDRVVRAGKFTMGSEVRAFEEEFAAWHGMKHAIMVNSGSSANLVAVAALGEIVELRDETAIVPAIAWSTTYAPLVQFGMDLRIADVDETWNAPPSIPLHHTAVVVACSVLGNPAHLARWKERADAREACLIEDNCESFGALTPERKLCGTHGIMNTFSLFWSHQISAIEGGVILTDDDQCNDLCRMLRAHGWTRDLPRASPVPPRFEEEYDFRVFGYNARPLEMHAAIARAQLRKASAEQASWRRVNCARFELMVRNADLPLRFPKYQGFPSPFGIAFECPSRAARASVVRSLRAHGVDCRLPTGGSFLAHPYGSPWRFQETPNADRIHNCGLFLGNPPWPIKDKLELAIKAIGLGLGVADLMPAEM